MNDMKFDKKKLLGILLVMLFLAGCSKSEPNKINIENEIRKVEQTIHSCIGWAKTKDLDRLYNVIADDSSYLEVHPNDKVVKGIDEFRKLENFWMSPDFEAIRYEIRDLDIRLSESGTVAWWYCILDDINEWKGEPAAWENTRWTGICEKRQGKWVVVQMHFSFADN
jgi:ketosteroid isomerase-like protein